MKISEQIDTQLQWKKEEHEQWMLKETRQDKLFFCFLGISIAIAVIGMFIFEPLHNGQDRLLPITDSAMHADSGTLLPHNEEDGVRQVMPASECRYDALELARLDKLHGEISSNRELTSRSRP